MHISKMTPLRVNCVFSIERKCEIFIKVVKCPGNCKVSYKVKGVQESVRTSGKFKVSWTLFRKLAGVQESLGCPGKYNVTREGKVEMRKQVVLFSRQDYMTKFFLQDA